jgi:hypothetical protein
MKVNILFICTGFLPFSFFQRTEGEWSHNRRIGYGTYYYINGNRYINMISVSNNKA